MTLEIVGGGIKPPTVIINDYSSGALVGYEIAAAAPGAKTLLSGVIAVPAQWNEVLNITNATGYVEYLSLRNLSGPRFMGGRLTVDDVVVFENNAGDITSLFGFHIVGHGMAGSAISSASSGFVSFSKNIKLEVYFETAGTDEFEVKILYNLT